MEKINNIDYKFIKNDKFKTNMITIYFKEKVSKENKINRKSLPSILLDKTNEYDTKLKLSRKMSSLYSSSLRVNQTNFGSYSLLTFSINYIHKKYIDKDITKDIIDFLYQVIYNPYSKDNKFDDNSVKRLKNEYYNLLKRKEQSFPVKTKEQAVINLFEDQEITEDIVTKSLVDKIDNKELFDYYQNVLKTNSVLIVVEGHEDIKDYFTKFTSTVENNKEYSLDDLSCIDKGVIINKDKTTQANLCFIYDNFDNSYDFRLNNLFFAMLLGETPNSLLFQEVREKHSLAYSISANYDSTFNLLYINGGVKSDSIDFTIKLIDEILEKLKTEDMTDLIEETKIYYLNYIDSALDNKGFLSSRESYSWLRNHYSSIEETKNKIKNVTKEDINKIACTMQSKIKYVLVGEDNE